MFALPGLAGRAFHCLLPPLPSAFSPYEEDQQFAHEDEAAPLGALAEGAVTYEVKSGSGLVQAI